MYVPFSQDRHIDLRKVRLCNSLTTWINCHLLSVNGGLENSEGPIVRCHWYAEHYSNTIRTFSGSDNKLVSLPLDLWGDCSKTAPMRQTETAMRPGGHLCIVHRGPKHPYLSLHRIPKVYRSSHVLKGTHGLFFSKQFTCRFAEKIWNILLACSVEWGNNQWWTLSECSSLINKSMFLFYAICNLLFCLFVCLFRPRESSVWKEIWHPLSSESTVHADNQLLWFIPV